VECRQTYKLNVGYGHESTSHLDCCCTATCLESVATLPALAHKSLYAIHTFIRHSSVCHASTWSGQTLAASNNTVIC
jgi:hypothetical protein